MQLLLDLDSAFSLLEDALLVDSSEEKPVCLSVKGWKLLVYAGQPLILLGQKFSFGLVVLLLFSCFDVHSFSETT